MLLQLIPEFDVQNLLQLEVEEYEKAAKTKGLFNLLCLLYKKLSYICCAFEKFKIINNIDISIIEFYFIFYYIFY